MKERGWKITKNSVILYSFDPDITGQTAVLRTAEEIGAEYEASIMDKEGVVVAQFYLDANSPQERKMQIEDVINIFKKKIEGAL